MGADLERTAIMRLQEAANMSERFYKAPLIVTTSGGKDSSVCIALAERQESNLKSCTITQRLTRRKQFISFAMN